jgi:hypothetical protein
LAWAEAALEAHAAIIAAAAIRVARWVARFISISCPVRLKAGARR